MTDREMLKECVDRITRVETRLIVLGLKLGYDLAEADNITVDVTQNKITITAVDITLSNITRAARAHGLHGKEVYIYFKGALIASLKV